MLEKINPTMLAEYVGASFEVVDDPARTFTLTLSGVVEHVKTEQEETFSLFFHGPPDPFMPQAIHKLKNERMGEVSLFLVPVGQDREGFRYESVFNRRLK
jgi:hypothetical protein